MMRETTRDVARRHIAEIARYCLGPENARYSSETELRFGNKGSISVEIGDGDNQGSWWDYEHQCGGGPYELMYKHGGCCRGDERKWLTHNIGLELPPTLKERTVCVYRYDDETGALLFEVVRLRDPKDFLQRRDAWQRLWSVKGCRMVPYRLPELVAASLEAWIYIVEGEKDADRAHSIGLIATTCPGGAGKWRRQYNEFFRGFRVALVPDNDATGRTHMEEIAANLAGVATDIRLVDLVHHMPDLAHKDDLSVWLDRGGTREILEELVANAPSHVPSTAGSSQTRDGDTAGTRAETTSAESSAALKLDSTASEIPKIVIVRGELHRAADEGLAALWVARVPFYIRNFELVRICTVKAKTWDGEVIEVPAVFSVEYPALRRAMSQSAYWMRPGLKSDYAVDCPKDLVELVRSMVNEWPFPPLAGLISTPTLRPDGSILAVEGYDDQTGLFLTGLPKMPLIPDRPSEQDTVEAVGLLDELLAEFPFASDASRSVGLSGLITPIVRGATGPVPMHLIVKPKPGTGGSYLVDIASMIATGERCPVIAMGDPKHPEEFEKRLVGGALRGWPIIGIDNVRGTLEGDFLCQVTERPVLQLRPLGTSKPAQIPNSFTTFANGNNPSIADDMVRRTVRSAMDANMENPEDRQFRSDPLAMVRRDRGRYVAAALTIVRAYIVAGKPDRLRPLASYEPWSDLVRSSLAWLGRADPVATMEETRVEDPRQEARIAIFEAWKSEVGLGQKYQTPELIRLAQLWGQVEAGSVLSNGLLYPKFHAALLKVAEVKGQIDPTRLGNWLRDNNNAIVLDLKLTVDRSDKARPKWVIDQRTGPK
jgi:putative DNA primase/helicase